MEQDAAHSIQEVTLNNNDSIVIDVVGKTAVVHHILTRNYIQNGTIPIYCMGYFILAFLRRI